MYLCQFYDIYIYNKAQKTYVLDNIITKKE